MTFNKLDKLLGGGVYSEHNADKVKKFTNALKEVALHHYNNCVPYKKLCDARKFNPENEFDIEDLPYLPTSLFKHTLLLSVPENKLFREINSSATTTGEPSRMGLDKETSRRQTKCFNRTIIDRIGSKRKNFLVLDESSTIERSARVTARSSTIKPLLGFANKVTTCIDLVDRDLKLDLEKFDQTLQDAEQNREDLIVFGFTFIFYIYVIKELLKVGKKYHLPNTEFIHIGGWKKLQEKKVTPEKLIEDCETVFGVKEKNVIDLYGFTEQSGIIYPSCEFGRRHVPDWAWVIVRDPLSLKPISLKKEGLLQFLSPIQTSYPGHSVLTEDVGAITGVNDCPCGRKGITFKVIGRAENAEVRGCGDIMAEKFA